MIAIDNKFNSLKDIEQSGVRAGLASLPYVFQVRTDRGPVERFAYDGMQSNVALYAPASVAEGSLGISAKHLVDIRLV
ncbi:MAG: hypothetical protein WDZ52_07760 [Pseudohongiellaceae bacterium]